MSSSTCNRWARPIDVCPLAIEIDFRCRMMYDARRSGRDCWTSMMTSWCNDACRDVEQEHGMYSALSLIHNVSWIFDLPRGRSWRSGDRVIIQSPLVGDKSSPPVHVGDAASPTTYLHEHIIPSAETSTRNHLTKGWQNPTVGQSGFGCSSLPAALMPNALKPRCS